MSVSVSGEIRKAGRRLFVALDDEGYYRERLGVKFRAGQRVRVTVDAATRSVEANAYLWGVVYELIVSSLDDGTAPEDLHEHYVAKFLPNETKRLEFYSKLTGETVVTDVDTRRSSKLSGGPFFDFVEKIRDDARTFFGVETPDPDKSYWRKRKAA